MKVLENKKLTVQQNGKFIDYKQLIRNCLDDVPTSPATGAPLGFSRSDMRNRDRIEMVIDKPGDEIKFEDTDADNLKRLVVSMRWAMRHKEILEFIESVENMEVYKEEVKEEAEDSKVAKKDKKKNNKADLN